MTASQSSAPVAAKMLLSTLSVTAIVAVAQVAMTSTKNNFFKLIFTKTPRLNNTVSEFFAYYISNRMDAFRVSAFSFLKTI